MVHSKQTLIITLASLLLVGAGCVATEVSSFTPEEASAELTLVAGNSIVVQPTILGVGGKVVGWFGADEEERLMIVDEWVAGEKVSVSWSISTQIETAESTAAREAHRQQYASSPVGMEIPDEPEPVYEERVVAGSIASESLASADLLSLPEAWQEDDAGVSESSLIWLSRSHYDELVNTRATVVSLGLFDESLMRVEDATNQFTSIVDKLSGLLDPILGTDEQPAQETAEDTQSLLTLQADPAWGEYVLLVDGVKTSARVVEAKNAFASYKILANADNPLILEIQLTPLSRGSLELLSSEGFTEGVGGYEVTQINQKAAE